MNGSSSDRPRKVSPHESLQERPRLFGVGFPVLMLAGMALWVAYNVFGLWTLPTAAVAAAGGVFVWAVRKARERDAFAVEAFVLSVFAPRRYEAQPHAEDPPRKPEASIPPRAPK